MVSLEFNWWRSSYRYELLSYSKYRDCRFAIFCFVSSRLGTCNGEYGLMELFQFVDVFIILYQITWKSAIILFMYISI